MKCFSNCFIFCLCSLARPKKNNIRLYFETSTQHQCGKPFFSNTRQNGEWTEISTRQNEIELAMFGE
jgi:hypothetical protein